MYNVLDILASIKEVLGKYMCNWHMFNLYIMNYINVQYCKLNNIFFTILTFKAPIIAEGANKT